jgi:uncharacterized protein YkwD
MGRAWRIAAVICPCVLVLLLAAVLAARADASPQDNVIARINAFRRDHGLRTLRVSQRLMGSAQAYSDTMMEDQYFGHANRIQASAKYKRLGEILEIHQGRKAGIGTAFRDWLNSPPHLGVILDPSFTYIGGGYSMGRFHGSGETIWVMHFGRL